MSEQSQHAIELHHQKYNCAQAVFCTYAGQLGLDEKTAFALSEGLGGGIGGRRQGTCGAVTGMVLLAGLINSSGDIQKAVTKQETYQLVTRLMEEFEKKNSSSLCYELLGGNGKPKLRSCDGCIEDACQLVEEHLLPLLKEKQAADQK